MNFDFLILWDDNIVLVGLHDYIDSFFFSNTVRSNENKNICEVYSHFLWKCMHDSDRGFYIRNGFFDTFFSSDVELNFWFDEFNRLEYAIKYSNEIDRWWRVQIKKIENEPKAFRHAVEEASKINKHMNDVRLSAWYNNAKLKKKIYDRYGLSWYIENDIIYEDSNDFKTKGKTRYIKRIMRDGEVKKKYMSHREKAFFWNAFDQEYYKKYNRIVELSGLSNFFNYEEKLNEYMRDNNFYNFVLDAYDTRYNHRLVYSYVDIFDSFVVHCCDFSELYEGFFSNRKFKSEIKRVEYLTWFIEKNYGDDLSIKPEIYYKSKGPEFGESMKHYNMRLELQSYLILKNNLELVQYFEKRAWKEWYDVPVFFRLFHYLYFNGYRSWWLSENSLHLDLYNTWYTQVHFALKEEMSYISLDKLILIKKVLGDDFFWRTFEYRYPYSFEDYILSHNFFRWRKMDVYFYGYDLAFFSFKAILEDSLNFFIIIWQCLSSNCSYYFSDLFGILGTFYWFLVFRFNIVLSYVKNVIIFLFGGKFIFHLLKFLTYFLFLKNPFFKLFYSIFFFFFFFFFKLLLVVEGICSILWHEMTLYNSFEKNFFHFLDFLFGSFIEIVIYKRRTLVDFNNHIFFVVYDSHLKAFWLYLSILYDIFIDLFSYNRSISFDFFKAVMKYCYNFCFSEDKWYIKQKALSEKLKFEGLGSSRLFCKLKNIKLSVAKLGGKSLERNIRLLENISDILDARKRGQYKKISFNFFRFFNKKSYFSFVEWVDDFGGITFEQRIESLFFFELECLLRDLEDLIFLDIKSRVEKCCLRFGAKEKGWKVFFFSKKLDFLNFDFFNLIVEHFKLRTNVKLKDRFEQLDKFGLKESVILKKNVGFSWWNSNNTLLSKYDWSILSSMDKKRLKILIDIVENFKFLYPNNFLEEDEEVLKEMYKNFYKVRKDEEVLYKYKYKNFYKVRKKKK